MVNSVLTLIQRVRVVERLGVFVHILNSINLLSQHNIKRSDQDIVTNLSESIRL